MKTNELRIGNFTQSAGGIVFKVTSEDLQFIEAGSLAKPIPLTEEWLLKCSFKFKKLGYNNLSVSNHLLSGNFFFMIGGYAKQIYYVHELQNLYFALTGKELEIIS